jgi:DNA-binding PadR family transcriptional regulator
MMVLGLVVRQPDTVNSVARRLAEEFASADFPRSSAHTNLPSLADQGLVRRVERGPERSLDRYEATDAGVEHLRKWLRQSTPRPAIRDALQGRLEFTEIEDLAALVEVVREEESVYRSACDMMHGRLLREQRARRRLEKPSDDWRTRLRGIQTRDAVTLWSTMSLRLERLRDELEGLLDDLATDSRLRTTQRTHDEAG